MPCCFRDPRGKLKAASPSSTELNPSRPGLAEWGDKGHTVTHIITLRFDNDRTAQPGTADGSLAMVTLRLDLDDLLKQANGRKDK